jgi:hypothetical protein
MSSTSGVSQKIDIDLFGLFELDSTGTVLYHRVDPPSESSTAPLNIAGRNFYDEVAPFQNTKEFKEFVTEFTDSEKFADSFNFECQCKDNDQPVRVLLARICEAASPTSTKSILVHIRRAA